jgi:hypothetical protein
MEFKIHVLRQKKSSFDIASTADQFADIVPSVAEYITGAIINPNAKGKIPNWFCFNPPISNEVPADASLKTTNIVTSCKMKDLGISSNFRAMYETIETFQKTIEPGDYWNFSHIHNCGSGIDLQVLSTFGTTGINAAPGQDAAQMLNSPYLYTLLFEVKGKLCEAFFIEPNGSGGHFINTIIGVSPTFYSYEYKTTMNCVRDPNVTAAGAPQMPFLRRSRLRPVALVNTDTEQTGTKTEKRASRFSLLSFEPTPAQYAANAGSYWIPYESPTALATRGTSSGTNPG